MRTKMFGNGFKIHYDAQIWVVSFRGGGGDYTEIRRDEQDLNKKMRLGSAATISTRLPEVKIRDKSGPLWRKRDVSYTLCLRYHLEFEPQMVFFFFFLGVFWGGTIKIAAAALRDRERWKRCTKGSIKSYRGLRGEQWMNHSI